MQIAQRWLIAKLRHHKFFSLSELNAAISPLLTELNAKPFKKKIGSRYSQFIELEQAALAKLPATRYEHAYFKQLKVNLDYHVELDHHYYSVPYYLAGEVVQCRYTASAIEIFHHHKRVASHVKSYAKNEVTTCTLHMPRAHKAHANWTLPQFLKLAKVIGNAAASVAQTMLHHKKHPEQIYRLHLGFRYLVKRYGNARVNRACARAIAINSICYQSIESILKTGLDQQNFIQVVRSKQIANHQNIRGSDYYK